MFRGTPFGTVFRPLEGMKCAGFSSILFMQEYFTHFFKK